MNTNQGIFQRVEKKYLLKEETYEAFRARLQQRVIPDQYGDSTICNIYFDTPDHRLIRESLEKPVYKEKLRLRSYGTPGAQTTTFLELKKKYKGVVYKRRIALPFQDAEQYLYRHEKLEEDSQISHEIDWFLQFYATIRPAMFLSYDRTALYDSENSDLRITFDRNICWREEALHLNRGVWGNQLLDAGDCLLEIKIPGALPVWLSQLLGELQIYPISFSKYGRAYLQSTGKLTQQKEGTTCA